MFWTGPQIHKRPGALGKSSKTQCIVNMDGGLILIKQEVSLAKSTAEEVSCNLSRTIDHRPLGLDVSQAESVRDLSHRI